MILNSKQLEELENIQDGSGDFDEESGDSEGYVEGVENALAWRRGMIERAVTSIRKIIRKPLDSVDGMVSGSLLYLNDSKKFVRLIENENGTNELTFVSPFVVAPPSVKGKKLEKPIKRGKKEKIPEANASERAEKASNTDKAQKQDLDKAKTVKRAPPAVASKEKTKKFDEPVAKTAATAKKTVLKAEVEKEAKKAPLKKKPAPKAKSTLSEKAKKTKVSPPKSKKTSRALETKKPKPVSKKQTLKKKPKKSASMQKPIAGYSSKNADPVADPNAYIRGNFRLMSNKELSHVTGLSEHTIRRKLGEWGLRRL